MSFKPSVAANGDSYIKNQLFQNKLFKFFCFVFVAQRLLLFFSTFLSPLNDLNFPLSLFPQFVTKGGFVGQTWAIQKLYSICVSFKIVVTFIPISALLKMAEAILKHVLELATAYRYSKYIIKGVCHEIFNIQFLFCFSDAHCRV